MKLDELFEKIANLLPNFNHRDKVVHLILGAFVALVSVLTCLVIGNVPTIVIFWIALSSSVILGAWKEYYDYNRDGYLKLENLLDFTATVLGGFIVSVMYVGLASFFLG